MSRTKIEIVKNDKLYDLNFTLQDASGVAVDITGATLKFKAQKSDEDTLAVDGNMVVDDGDAGTCHYQVAATDFDEAGTYNAEIQVTFLDNQVSTWTDIIIVVKDELPK